MKCRGCGTEIAEKALICFRCGAAVKEPVTKPARLKKSGQSVFVYLVFCLLVVMAVLALWIRSH